MLSPNQIEEIQAQAFCGVASELEGVCKIKPMTIKEIMEFGNLKYQSVIGTLLLTEVEIAEMIKKKTGKEPNIEKIYPLNYLLQSASFNDTFLLELQSYFSTFIKEDILLLPKINSILIGAPQERRLITNDNFSDFQDIIRIQNGKKIKEPPPENESEIARKFRLKREARDVAKKKQQEKNGEGQSLGELFEIAETFGIDYQNKTLYAFYKLIRRFQAREKWNQDLQMLCAGADSTKLKTKYWGESLDEK